MVIATVINLKKYRQSPITLIPHLGPFKIHETFTWSTDHLEPRSFLAREGVFGIEYYASMENSRIQVFTCEQLQGVARYHKPVLFSTNNQDLKSTSIYYIASKKSSIFPFSFNLDQSIWSELNQKVTDNLDDQKVFIQLIVQSQESGKWMETLEKDHELYLKGIDHPVSFLPIRMLQEKIVEWTEKHEGWKTVNPIVEGLNQKLQEPGYRVAIRLAIHGGTDMKNDRLIKSIVSAFKMHSGQNQWGVYPVGIGKKTFIENLQMRRMPLFHGRSQFLCEAELVPLFQIEPIELPLKKEEDIISEVVRTKPKQTGSLIDYLPLGHRTNQKENEQKLEQNLNEAFKKVGLIKGYGLKIQKLQNGATLKKVTFAMMEGLKLSDIENRKKDIQAELGLKGLSVEQGSDPGTAAVLIPQEKRSKVFLRDLMESDNFKKFCTGNDLPFLVGVDAVGEVIMDCLTRVKHILLAGQTGSGKSVWLNQFILTLLMLKKPEEMRMYLIDPKIIELSIFEPYPHVAEVITEAEKAVLLMAQLVEEMNNRYKEFAKVKARNIKQYNAKEAKKMDYIVVIFDEFTDLIMTVQQIKDHVIMLAQKARACGIHLILCTQRPEVKIVDGLLKSNLPSRIVFTLKSQHDYATVLDNKPAFKLLGRGDGVAEIEGMEEQLRFQGCLIADGDEETDGVINKIADVWNGKAVAVKHELPEAEVEVEDEQEVEIDDLERLKRIIAETGETRIRELQKELKIRINTVKELMDQLVGEGWLQAPDKPRDGYKVLLSEDQLEKYLQDK